VAAAEIRDWRDEDAEPAATLLREVAPYWLVTPAMLRFEAHVLPPRARRRLWVAEADGELVAYADANMRWTSVERDRGEIWVAVAPDVRRHGIGRALYERAEKHLGANVLDTEAADDDGVSFAEALGFRVTGLERYSELDPQTAELPEDEPPSGVAVVPLGEFLDRPRELHAVYAEAELDMPSDFERERLDYDEWVAETLENPLLDAELSRVVLDDGRPVSFALVTADREGRRAEHELTGTLRSHRGRGLARLAKVAAIRACKQAGIERLLTSNEGTNAAMLAINERLGYRPTIVATRLEKRLRRE
jgi:GNAT superfamily N-acetyltransferase